jgi:hypothetical protein
MLHTEYEFTLPVGYVDAGGSLHRGGVMRLCTALDELEALEDPRVRAKQAYLSVVLLSRVIERIGEVTDITPDLVERLFSADFAYLQALFVRLNDVQPPGFETQCPNCGSRFALDLNGVGAAGSVT